MADCCGITLYTTQLHFAQSHGRLTSTRRHRHVESVALPALLQFLKQRLSRARSRKRTHGDADIAAEGIINGTHLSKSTSHSPPRAPSAWYRRSRPSDAHAYTPGG